MVIQTEPDPAPLVRAELERSLLPFGQSRMLPRMAYVDADVFAWEQRHFFDGGRICSSPVTSGPNHSGAPVCS
jgi:hypothetical protein